MQIFDEKIDRFGTGCTKFDSIARNGYPMDTIPMWVADMDFRAPQCVQDALAEAVKFGIFGYSLPDESYFQAVQGWFMRHHGWQVQREWMLHTPGSDTALAATVRAATREGDAVLVMPPVYYPFYDVIRLNGRKLVESHLNYDDGRYTMNFADLEQKIRDNDVKLLLLCNPHNPVGRVWTVEELQTLGALVEKYNLTIVSDELHSDFSFPGHPHTPLLKACPQLAMQAVVCTSPSKSFNLAGLRTSNIFIPGEQLRAAFKAKLEAAAIREPNMLGFVACKAAYNGGEQWLEECKAYMRENLAYVRTFLQEKLPQIKLVEPESTYVAWLDCTGLGLNKEQLDDLILHKARIWLDTGSMFGDCSALFQRVVLACPRSVVAEAMERLLEAVNSLAKV
jgi:cystathionine beta-lyase